MGNLIADFHCLDPKKMHFESLAERSNYLKYQQREQQMSELFKELVREEKEKTHLEDKINFVTNLLRTTDLSEALIAANIQLTLDEVKELSRKIRKSKVAN